MARVFTEQGHEVMVTILSSGGAFDFNPMELRGLTETLKKHPHVKGVEFLTSLKTNRWYAAFLWTSKEAYAEAVSGEDHWWREVFLAGLRPLHVRVGGFIGEKEVLPRDVTIVR